VSFNRDQPTASNRYQAGSAALILDSHAHLLQRDLLPRSATPIEMAECLYDAPSIALAHDTAPDPIFFYANRQAQRLFEMPWAEMVALPSRHSAEPLAREDRQRLLNRVSRQGYIDDYAGARIARTGKRFLIANATVCGISSIRPAMSSARRRHSTIGPPLPDGT
jgi:hypothetical protein